MDGRRLLEVLAMVALVSPITVRAQCVSPYVVQEGDFLSKIAEMMGISVEEILAANPQITDPDLIFSGMSLTIPCPTPSAPNPGGGCSGGSKGDATFYYVGVEGDINSDVKGGFTACGEKFSNKEFVAALSFDDFDSSTSNPNMSPTCRMCAEVCGPAGTAVVKLKDKCEACKSGDIDLSPAAFLDVVGPLAIGRQPGVEWRIVNCP
eukprot:evm.model.scf_2714.1 EVM.evm.TU.scf_2714.1   scf_2714:6202-6822(+)